MVSSRTSIYSTQLKQALASMTQYKSWAWPMHRCAPVLIRVGLLDVNSLNWALLRSPERFVISNMWITISIYVLCLKNGALLFRPWPGTAPRRHLSSFLISAALTCHDYRKFQGPFEPIHLLWISCQWELPFKYDYNKCLISVAVFYMWITCTASRHQEVS